MTTETTTNDRVFLDASILFSIGQTETGLFQLGELADKGQCMLLASRYAIEKAIRNLRRFDDLKTLEGHLSSVQVVFEPDVRLRCPIELPRRARAVFMAAISSKADYFLTGDIECFGRYLGQRIMGVKICSPRGYLLEKQSKNVPHQSPRTSLKATSLE